MPDYRERAREILHDWFGLSAHCTDGDIDELAQALAETADAAWNAAVEAADKLFEERMPELVEYHGAGTVTDEVMRMWERVSMLRKAKP